MADDRTENADIESVYAVSKAGFRPFDCSRQALRRETLLVLAEAGLVPAVDPAPDIAPKAPAQVLDFVAARSRRDRSDPQE